MERGVFVADREKLIELIRGTPDVKVWPDAGAKLADHLISHGVTVQKWIPASEPPKEPGEYIVYTTQWEERTTLIWDGQDWCFMDGAIARDGFVTYWMPLPEPPKEEGK